MESLFDALEKEFNEALAAGRAAPSAADVQRQLDELLRQMSMEMRASGEVSRQALSLRVNTAKASLAHFKLDADRAALTQGANREGVTPQLAQQCQTVQDKIAQQNTAILNAHKSVAESEAVGNDIVFELGRNREKIQTSQAKAAEFRGELDSATARLKSMNDREKCCVS